MHLEPLDLQTDPSPWAIPVIIVLFIVLITITLVSLRRAKVKRDRARREVQRQKMRTGYIQVKPAEQKAYIKSLRNPPYADERRASIHAVEK